MQAKKDIESFKDIQYLVDTFYSKVRKDALLGVIFENVIRDDWPAHLEKMYRFWQTVLTDVHSYYGSPFRPHARLPIEKKHFERWLQLFEETVNEKFEGEKAKEATWRAQKMAEMFRMKIEYYKDHPHRSPL